MPASAAAQHFRYSAFISYSRKDEEHAAWLQAALEKYRLPKPLLGMQASGEALQSRLLPVFRDRSEMAAACDLEEALDAALQSSQSLIVLCTPSAARSDWVNREIESFRAHRDDHHIFAALFEGDELTAFPPALLEARGGPRKRTPLAADFRPAGDGQRLALLKIVSSLTGVGLGALNDRDATRRAHQLTLVAASSLAGMSVFALLAFTAFTAQRAAERERVASERVIESVLTDLREAVKPVGSLELLNKVNQAALSYYRGQTIADMPDAALAQRARLLMAMGEDDFARGKVKEAKAQFSEAHRTTAARLAADPDDPARIFDHSQSEYWLGYTAWETGDVTEALAGFNGYKRLADQLLEKDSSNMDWQMEAGFAESNLGVLELRQLGDSEAARQRFLAALAHFRLAHAANPGDAAIIRDIADGLGWLADSQRVSGQLDAALESRRELRAVLDQLIGRETRDAARDTGIVRNEFAISRIEAEKGEYAAAVKRLASAETGAAKLAAEDAESSLAAQQLRAIQLFRANMQLHLPAGARPARRDMEQTIGRCSRPPPLDGRELENLCHLTLARLLASNGEKEAARVLVAKVGAEYSRRETARLSEAFGIDFPREIAKLSEMLQ